MHRIDQTNNVKKARQLTYGGRTFFEVPAIGDGNCALNAFALGLIDLIKRDQLPALSETKKNQFMQAVANNMHLLRDRLALYLGERSLNGAAEYHDLADDLEGFIRFVSNRPSFDVLLKYIKRMSNTRLQIAALHVALAPALREIGHQLHLHAMLDEVGGLEQEDYSLGQDGENAGFELLEPLAGNFFGINLYAFDGRNGALIETVNIQHAPRLHMLRIVNPDHWNFLMPATQQDGLAEEGLLPGFEAAHQDHKKLMGPTIKLVAEEADKVRNFKRHRNSIKQELPAAAAIVGQITQNLLDMEMQPSSTATLQQKLVVDHSRHSTALLQAVRDHLRLSDPDLQVFKRATRLENELLHGVGEDRQPLTQDEALARSLQNAELLTFFSKHSTKQRSNTQPSCASDSEENQLKR